MQGSGLHFLYPAKEEGQEEEERRRRRKVRRRRRRRRNLLSYKRHTTININGILFRMSRHMTLDLRRGYELRFSLGPTDCCSAGTKREEAGLP